MIRSYFGAGDKSRCRQQDGLQESAMRYPGALFLVREARIRAGEITSMAIQIGAKPDSGFDNPLGMLKDCHRRIERFLRTLGIVFDRARGRSLEADEVQALQAALSYFREGGVRHTADEENSLFPRLRSLGATDALEEIESLESDHQEAGRLHEVVETLYIRWMNDGELDGTAGKQLAEALEQLQTLYSAHIRIEEETVFPRAAELLNLDSLKSIGDEFRARRA